MISARLTEALLLGQEGGAAQGLQTPMFLLTLITIFFLYMFIVQRPGARREQETRDAMLQKLKKNDRVLTTSGIYGVVTNVQLDADEITIRIDETTNTKLRVTKSAISRVLGGESGGEKDSKT